MAVLLDKITIGEKAYRIVDAVPSAGGGTQGAIGDVAVYEDGSVGKIYLKTGAANTAWEEISTTTSSGVIEAGVAGKLALYPSNGNILNDDYVQNSQNLSVQIAAQGSRTVDIVYTIPNPGNAITAADFVLTQGDQTIAGDKTFSDDVVVNGDLTINGTLTFVNSANLEVTDKLIRVNKGGAAASGGGAGIEIEEDGGITGYIKTNLARTGFALLAPAQAFEAELLLSSLSDDRNYTLPDVSGTFALGTGAASKVAFWSNANTLSSNSNFHWDNTNGRLGIGNSSPSVELHVTGSARITALNAAQPVRSDVNGVLSNSLISLTGDVSGVLPIANGGTNSSTALNNNRIMVSSGGAIVEAAALTNGQLLIGSTGAAPVAAAIAGTTNQVIVTNGAGSITLSLPQDVHTGASPSFVNMTLSGKTEGSVIFAGSGGVLSEDNANLFWNDNDNRLGLGTNTPARLLDVNGSSIFRGSWRLASATATNANYEMFQAQVATTDATVTTIATIAIPTDSAVLIEAKILGRRTGGSGGAAQDAAAYIRTARFRNVGGTVTIFNLQSDYTSENQAGWNGTLVVSGTNAEIRVNGAANNNVSWTVTYSVITL